ncbi:MAG: hypothetical protein B7Z37_24725 [Verrucomicrobia bacterium 12-59-8]|nr:MAG: hypothetical protein B7Z37_24725 [Verrucomicrobia bacterium 12-59-8]
MPVESKEERMEVDAVMKPALKALLDEFDAMGMTVEALPEMQTLAGLYPDDGRLKIAVQVMADSIVGKCSDGQRVKMGSAVAQLAAVAAGLKP